MKKMKKLASLVLALAMALTLAVPAFAAIVTISGDTENILKDRSFTAYQIFSGREENGVLSDIQWGNGIDSTKFLTALQNNTAFVVDGQNVFTGCDTAAKVAEVLGEKYTTDSDGAKLIAKLAYANKTETGVDLTNSATNMADGYYLIVDTTDADAVEDGAYNAALLQVVGNVTIRVKTDVPDVKKKVKENTQYTTDDGYGTGYNDVADYNIGDTVSFAFYSEVPDMAYYDTYEYTFHDSMSAGLTLDESSIVVTVGGTTLVKGTDYTVNTAPNHTHTYGDNSKTCTFVINIPDLKDIDGVQAGQAIKVTFNATLNKNAVIGLPGNPNEVMLEYSNNPNDEGNGKTEWDKVIVFTYELDVNKVDGANHETKLDAEFVLYRGSDDNKEYVKVDADGKVDGWVTDKNQASTLKSGDDGLFKVIGLDDGTYYLEETKAPAGYNLLTDPIEVRVNATTGNSQDWNGVPGSALTKLDVTAGGKTTNGNVDTGIVAIDVENNSGATLPETGGMGTTLFYALGAVLVIGAGVAMVTKKRMA